MGAHGAMLLRASLALVFVWFGLLKIVGRSPVADLVADTLAVVPPDVAVRGLGLLEVAVGLLLLSDRTLRVALLVLWAQLVGTLGLFVLQPRLMFEDGNPFFLTVLGEFVVKNLVLIAAGIALGGTLGTRKRETTSRA